MSGRYHLFERFGVEIEYMIVDRETLDVRPIADELMRLVAGEIVSDVVSPIDNGSITWSNELVLHVIELKTTEPATRAELPLLADRFQANVSYINDLLLPLGAKLMPTAMHPWMDPDREARVWPHDYSEIYAAFNRIFDCRGHGWSNLQSTHLNLPFANDEEFARLHAAVRLVLPILPALAASSPIVAGQATGILDTRLDVYRTNSARIPSIAAHIVPEAVFSEAEYRRQIFEPMWADIAPHDPEGVLQDEFLNARGAIARFERGSIEIRLLDAQECPAADMAIVQAVVAVLDSLVIERWTNLEEQQTVETESLKALLLHGIRDADYAQLDDAQFLAQFDFPGSTTTALELWSYLLHEIGLMDTLPKSQASALRTILEHGPLASRILESLDEQAAEKPAHELFDVYAELCNCLEQGSPYLGS